MYSEISNAVLKIQFVLLEHILETNRRVHLDYVIVSGSNEYHSVNGNVFPTSLPIPTRPKGC